ncbi:MAG: glycoside hydrolase family 3 protein [Anaerolineae bacterium]|jgi:beta-glucosidase
MRTRIISSLLVGVFLLTACATMTVEPTVEPTVELEEPTSPPEEETEPLYLDPAAPVEDRVADLLSRMTLEEKIGQMAQVSMHCIVEEDIRDRFLGSMLSGGGGSPRPNNPASWAEMVNGYQEYALQTRLGIPLIYGVDAVHGHNNVYGAVIFPHNVGLGAANNPELMERVGQVTAREMVATGIYWNFGPVVAVPQDIRWGRTYEGYSEDPEIVSTLSAATIRGLQNVDGERDLAAPTTVLATPKHFVGDGGTSWGTSTIYQIDQGVTEVDEATLREIHLAPYVTAIENGALSVMASFSSWQDTKMHAHQHLLTTVLKEELGFEGFVVSDWEAINQLRGTYYDQVVTAINAGIDMAMLPCNYDLFITALTGAVENGDVPAARVDDAVRRILTVKFQLGLFKQPFSNDALLEEVGSEAHREVAREAVRQSLVLLRNEGDVLPLDPNTPQILVSGGGMHDVGMQCGGWTISWQGSNGDITPGTTILDAIEGAISPETAVVYDRFGRFADVEGTVPVGIAVVGEDPYAEGIGDDSNLALSETDVEMLERIREKVDRLVVIIISGRPLIVTDYLEEWDGLVAAWLPGTEAQGITDVLFGDYPFVGKLPYTWPRSADQLPQGALDQEQALFPLGYGLTVGED